VCEVVDQAFIAPRPAAGRKIETTAGRGRWQSWIGPLDKALRTSRLPPTAKGSHLDHGARRQELLLGNRLLRLAATLRADPVLPLLRVSPIET